MNDSGKELFSANAMLADTGPSTGVAGDTISPEDPNLTVNAPKDINDSTGDLFASLPEFARKDVWMARNGGDSNVSVENDVRRIISVSPSRMVESKVADESEDFSIHGKLPTGSQFDLRIFAAPAVEPLPAGISDDEIPPPADVVDGRSDESPAASDQTENPAERGDAVSADVPAEQDVPTQPQQKDGSAAEPPSPVAEPAVAIAPMPTKTTVSEIPATVDQPVDSVATVGEQKPIESWTSAVDMDNLFAELPDKPGVPATESVSPDAGISVPEPSAAVVELDAHESTPSPVAEPVAIAAPVEPVVSEIPATVEQPAEPVAMAEEQKPIETWTPALDMDNLFAELPDKPGVPMTESVSSDAGQSIPVPEAHVAVVESSANESTPSPIPEPESVVAPAPVEPVVPEVKAIADQPAENVFSAVEQLIPVPETPIAVVEPAANESTPSPASEPTIVVAPAPVEPTVSETPATVEQPTELVAATEEQKPIESWAPAVDMDDLFAELPDKPAVSTTESVDSDAGHPIPVPEVPVAVVEPDANEPTPSSVAEPAAVAAPVSVEPVVPEIQTVVEQPTENVSLDIVQPIPVLETSVATVGPDTNESTPSPVEEPTAVAAPVPVEPVIPEPMVDQPIESVSPDAGQPIPVPEAPVTVVEPDTNESTPSPVEEPVAVAAPAPVEPVAPEVQTVVEQQAESVSSDVEQPIPVPETPVATVGPDTNEITPSPVEESVAVAAPAPVAPIAPEVQTVVEQQAESVSSDVEQPIPVPETPVATVGPDTNEFTPSPVEEPAAVAAPVSVEPVAPEVQTVVEQPTENVFPDAGQPISVPETPVVTVGPDTNEFPPSPVEEPAAVAAPAPVEPVVSEALVIVEQPTEAAAAAEEQKPVESLPADTLPQTEVVSVAAEEHAQDSVVSEQADVAKQPIAPSVEEKSEMPSESNRPEFIAISIAAPETTGLEAIVINGNTIAHEDESTSYAPADVTPESEHPALEKQGADIVAAPAEDDSQDASEKIQADVADDVASPFADEPTESNQSQDAGNTSDAGEAAMPVDAGQISEQPAVVNQPGGDDSGELPLGDVLVVDDVVDKDLGNVENNAVGSAKTLEERTAETKVDGAPVDSPAQENVGETDAGAPADSTEPQENLTMETPSLEEQQLKDGEDPVINELDDTEGQTVLDVAENDAPPYVPRTVAAGEIKFNTKPENLVEAEYRREYRHKISSVESLAELGAALKNIREQEGMSRKDLYEQTKISTLHIETIENGDMSELPPPYVVGYVRRICDVLSIDVDDLSEFFSGLLVYEIPEPKPTNKVMRSPEQERKLQIIAITIISLLVLFVLLVLSGIGFVCYRVYGVNNAKAEDAMVEKELRGYIRKPSLRITIMPKRVK